MHPHATRDAPRSTADRWVQAWWMLVLSASAATVIAMIIVMIVRPDPDTWIVKTVQTGGIASVAALAVTIVSSLTNRCLNAIAGTGDSRSR